MFIHLRTHSYYSFLQGIPAPALLAQAAANDGMPALGLTDHHGMSGAVEFYLACQEAGVEPILGLDVSVAQAESTPGPQQDPTGQKNIPKDILVVLAIDLTGWRSLCRLSSKLLGDTHNIGQDALPFDHFLEENEGLICLIGANTSFFSRGVMQYRDLSRVGTLENLKDAFTERLYIALDKTSPDGHHNPVQLALFAKQLKLPCVVSQPVYYLQPEQAGLQRLATAIRLNCRLDEVPGESLAPTNTFWLSHQEIEKRYAECPAALQASLEIAQRCRLRLPMDEPHFPVIRLPGGQKPEDALRAKAYTGARELYGELNDEIHERLDHELEIIEAKGYTSLFLIMEEIINFTRQADIPSASRGSASSSLVAHCLNITTPDPVRLNLYFERFLNPERTTPPDIDTDLCSKRREQVIQHVYQTYGIDRVAMVATINRFRTRSALREVAKAYGLPESQIKGMSEAIPHRYWQHSHSGEKPLPSPYAELSTKFTSQLHQTIFREAQALVETPHHVSIHAGGVVITPGALTDYLPTMQANKGMLITQFDLDSVEKLGLVKLDLLGIRGLSVLGDVADGLKNKEHPSRLAVLEAVPAEDTATAALVRSGNTIGCFQIESPGMRATLREIQADSIDDVLVALALYRPGPLSGGLKDAFVRRHLGQEPVSHLHPALENLLANTHGVILYQEQVLRIAHELAGLNLAEADLLRRAMSHFDPGKQMQNLKEKFVLGAMVHSHVPPETAERIWELMAAFAGYGFPKAHAASYAQLSWRSAWCKAHHPAEFLAAVLANWGGYYSQRIYLMEARRLGLTLRPPHINYAQGEFSVYYQDGQPILYMGLNQVRDLTRRTQRNIIQNHPFRSLTDFLLRADPRPHEAENLVRVGALEGMGNPSQLLAELKGAGEHPGQLPLFTLTEPQMNITELHDWSPQERAAQQEAILGVSIDYHPLELLAKQFEQDGVVTTVEATSHTGERVRVAGMRQTWRRVATSNNRSDYLMELEDMEGVLVVLVPTALYQHNRTAFSNRVPLIAEGTLEVDASNAEPLLRAEKVWRAA
jgi:DNA polymerase-3 subunit alpha